MVKITKAEMNYLVKNGVPYYENGIIATRCNSGKTWYMTETDNNKKLLKNFRNSIVRS